MIGKISSKALELGFIGIGFSRPVKPLFIEEYKSWVKAGRNAEMSWLSRNMDIRENPSRLLPECKTIISLAYPYPSEKPSTKDGYTLARYSQPLKQDYHLKLKSICRELTNVINEQNKVSKSRICVDSAPIMERSFAYMSGVGFIGKNNMLIIPEYGSFFYLAEILTTAEFDIPEITPQKNRCGSCNECIKSCPTGALKGPNDFNSSKCLSYLSIEYTGEIDRSIKIKMGNCFFGCDICQEVCPFNKVLENKTYCISTVNEFMEMDKATFKKMYGNSALSRAGIEKIKGNINILTENL